MPHVTAVQFRPCLDRSKDEQRLAALVQTADPTDLLVMPECCLTGYTHPPGHYRSLAERPNGPTFALFRQFAMRKRAYVVGGFIEDAGPLLYNSALVIDPAGHLVSVYRKQWLYVADQPWAQHSTAVPPIIETPGFTFAVGICMDINSDLFLQWAAQAKIDVLAFPTNWVFADRYTRAAGREKDGQVWPYWTQRWQGQSSVLVAANTWGAQADSEFIGKSAILNQHKLLATAGQIGDQLITASW